MNGPFEVRALVEDDWAILRDLRLLALRTEPGVFLRSYDEEAGRDEAGWRAWLTGQTSAMFALFDAGRPIGISGVVTSNDDPSGKTALFVATFLLPEYRGRGLSAPFFAARLGWVRARPQFELITVEHRATNEASARAIRAHGFRKIATQSHRWPDGAVAESSVYELLVSEIEPGR